MIGSSLESLRSHHAMFWCALAVLTGCAVEQGSSEPEPDDPSRIEKFEGLEVEPDSDLNLAEGGNATATCPAGNHIYLMSRERVLLRFDPNTLETVEVGTVACATEGLVNSMAIDRQGSAWVGNDDGSIFQVSTADATCQGASFSPTPGWGHFGMAFVTDGPDTEAESLYLTRVGAPGDNALGRVDTEALTMAVVGILGREVDGDGCELTGKGDGRMYGFCPGTDTILAEIEKDDATILSTEALPFARNKAWAFAHYGGAFYIFTAVYDGETRVDLFTPGEGTQRLLDALPYTILGAGVSTCAPTSTVVK